MIIVRDRIKKVEQIGVGVGVRIVTPNPLLLCVCGFLVESSGLFMGDHVCVSTNWRCVGDLWHDGIYDGLIGYDLKNGVPVKSSISYMIKIRNMKMYRVDTCSGRCGIFGVKSSLLMGDNKLGRMRKASVDDEILCVRF